MFISVFFPLISVVSNYFLYDGKRPSSLVGVEFKINKGFNHYKMVACS